MLDIKLTTFLQTLSRHDLAQFKKYLRSPFFNERQDLEKLFDLLDPSKQGQEGADTGKEESKARIWEALYPGKPYADLRFRRLCSDLLQLAMDFAALQQYSANPATGQVFLLHALASTQLEKHFEGVVRQTELLQQKSGVRDADFHYLSYMLQRRRREYLEQIAHKNAPFEPIEKADYHLDCYYLTKKLEHYCDALGYRNMMSASAEINLLPGFMDYLQDSPFLREPSVKAWYLVAQMMINRDQEHFFQEMKQLLALQGGSFQKKERQTLFIHSMNYCIDVKINNGRTDYYLELFQLYRIALDQEIIFNGDELDPHHYKNIITIALQLREFEWVENFIRDYTPRLPKPEQDNAFNFNLAQVYFYRGEYGKVIELLREVEYQNIAYSLGGRLLLLRTYFELGEVQALESLISSFSIFLRRNKLISKEVQQQYLNMLRFTRKLFHLPPFDHAALTKIQQELEACKSLAAKKWLIEKVAKLKSGR